MNAGPSLPPSSVIWNVPNQLTLLRLELAVVMFVLMSWGSSGAYLAALVLFLVAAATDWLDGFLARRYRMVTVLGRVLDPFADKIIICGTFILLAADPRMIRTPWALPAWMVVVIVARELSVTGLRSLFEERGVDFSAKQSGKWKMALQCVAAVVGLWYVSYTERAPGEPWWVWCLLVASTWSALVLTVYSGVVYVLAAIRLMRGPPLPPCFPGA